MAVCLKVENNGLKARWFEEMNMELVFGVAFLFLGSVPLALGIGFWVIDRKDKGNLPFLGAFVVVALMCYWIGLNILFGVK